MIPSSSIAAYSNCRFYKDNIRSDYWGEEKYSGGVKGSAKNFPGTGGLPALTIPANRFVVHFCSTGSRTDPTAEVIMGAWGFKLTVVPRGLKVSSFAPPLNDLPIVF